VLRGSMLGVTRSRVLQEQVIWLVMAVLLHLLAIIPDTYYIASVSLRRAQRAVCARLLHTRALAVAARR
jgi:hypothetical protein